MSDQVQAEAPSLPRHHPRPDRPTRIGVQVRSQHSADYAEVRAAVVAAEEAGADLVLGLDHFFPAFGDPEGTHYEAWTMLAAWAEITERAELGVLVTAIGFRNPNLLADMARTVDRISGGRVILGIGSGWAERDYAEYGFEFGTAPERLRRLQQELPVIRDRWTRLNPPPLRDIPVLVGGAGEKVTLRIAAEHADIWHANVPAEELIRKSAVLDEWCRTIGRDPGEIERGTGIVPWPTREPGILDDYLGQAEEFWEAGARLFTVGLEALTKWEMGPIRELIAWRDEKNRSLAQAGATAP